MDEPADELEREESGSQATRPSDRVKCLTQWVENVLSRTQTGGPWSQEEKNLHINCLELLAATLAVKIFLKDQVNKQVLQLLDNQTAVAYTNNLGGTVSTQTTILARELWTWCLERDILLTVEYHQGKENIRADTESRVMKDRSDWMLNPSIFQRLLPVPCGRSVCNMTELPTAPLL